MMIVSGRSQSVAVEPQGWISSVAACTRPMQAVEIADADERLARVLAGP